MDALPTEMLDHILGKLMHDPDFDDETENGYFARVRTFSSLSKVSRRLRKLTEPYLYSHFDRLVAGKSTRLLLRTICRRRELAEHVKFMNLVPTRRKAKRKLSRSDRSLFTSAAESLQDNPIWPLFQISLIQGCHTAEILLLLCLTKQLTSLSMNIWHRDTDDEIRASGLCVLCPPMEICLQSVFSPNRLDRERAYSKLTAIWIDGQCIGSLQEPEFQGMSHTALSTVMQLPSLRLLECSGINPSLPTDEWHCPDQVSNLQSLHLKLSNVDSGAMSNLIRACKQLQALSIDLWLEQCEETAILADVNITILMDAIHCHQHSLTSLSISNRNEKGLAWTLQTSPSIGSLSDFTHLIRLEVDEGILKSPTPTKDIDLQSILAPNLDHLIIHSERDITRLKDILEAILRANPPSTMEWLEVTFPCTEDINDEYREIVEEWGPGLDEWALERLPSEKRIKFWIIEKQPALRKIVCDVLDQMPEGGIVELLKRQGGLSDSESIDDHSHEDDEETDDEEDEWEDSGSEDDEDVISADLKD